MFFQENKKDENELIGRNDGGSVVVIPNSPIDENSNSGSVKNISVGDYVVTQIYNVSGSVLLGIPLYHSSIVEFSQSHSVEESLSNLDNSRYQESMLQNEHCTNFTGW